MIYKKRLRVVVCNGSSNIPLCPSHRGVRPVKGGCNVVDSDSKSNFRRGICLELLKVPMAAYSRK